MWSISTISTPLSKFTNSFSFTNIAFLDVNVSLNNGKIETNLYTEPTDKHQHLLFLSCHPRHTKKAIPFSLALRLCRICSTEEVYNRRASELTKYLLNRGYNRSFLSKQIQHATDIPRIVALKVNVTSFKRPNRVPFIISFNPSLPHISNIIKKHFSLLHTSNRCKQAFPHPPIVFFRRSLNLRDILVEAKLPSEVSNKHTRQLPPGSYRCEQNCATYPYINDGLTQYTFFSTGETCTIKFHFTCNTKNLIYMIQCNR